jgi:hypothetical protein
MTAEHVRHLVEERRQAATAGATPAIATAG